MEDYQRVYELTRDVREEFIRDLDSELRRLEARGFPEPETAIVHFKLKALEELTLRELRALEDEQLRELRGALNRVFDPS